MHALNKKDDHHGAIESKADAYAVLSVDEDESDPSGGSTGGTDSVEPEMPESDDGTGGGDMAACPDCGDDLGPEQEVVEFIAKHGEAFCEGCDARIVAEADA